MHPSDDIYSARTSHRHLGFLLATDQRPELPSLEEEHLLWSGAVAGQVDVPAQELHCCLAHRNTNAVVENGLPATFLFWSRESQEEACCRGVKCGHTT